MLEKDMVFGGTTTSTPHIILTEQIMPLVNGYNIKGVELDGDLAKISEIADTYRAYVGQDGIFR